MQLRPYQRDAVDGCIASLRQHNTSLIVMPTGTGKTVVFSELISKASGRVMVIAHREELITQAARKVEAVCGYRPSIEMAELRDYGGMFGSRCVVASVQTLNAPMGDTQRRSKFNPHEFSLLVIDEAHHAVAKSYMDTINYFRRNPKLKVCGVSATPDRADKLALGQVFEDVGYKYEIFDAIDDGWLVPVVNNQVMVESLDFSHVGKSGADLNQRDLSKVVELESSLHGIATPCVEIAEDRKTLLFATSVNQAHDLCAIINRHGKKAVFVHGGTPKDTRREMVRRYKSGEYQFLCNVGIATEGFDDPSIEVVAIARPTCSRALMCQMVGRGTRPLAGTVDGHPSAEMRKASIARSGKPSVEIIDFVGNSSRHRLATAADVLGGKYPDDVVDRANAIAQASDGPEDLIKLMERASAEKDEEEARFGITAAGDKMKLTAKAKYRQKKGDPFDVLQISAQRVAKHSPKQLTARHQAMLTRSGIDIRDLNMHQQSVLYGEVLRRMKAKQCTYKQAKILKKFGYRGDMSFQQASHTLDTLASNGWKRK
jgi:superfamily II DNA or RNA helicase